MPRPRRRKPRPNKPEIQAQLFEESAIFSKQLSPTIRDYYDKLKPIVGRKELSQIIGTARVRYSRFVNPHEPIHRKGGYFERILITLLSAELKKRGMH